MQMDCCTLDSGKAQAFDGELLNLLHCMQKQVIVIMEPFLSFMLSFQPNKAHNMLVLMLDFQYKGLGLVIQYVSKQNALYIASEHDK
jgi:hypothetical protein